MLSGKPYSEVLFHSTLTPHVVRSDRKVVEAIGLARLEMTPVLYQDIKFLSQKELLRKGQTETKNESGGINLQIHLEE